MTKKAPQLGHIVERKLANGRTIDGRIVAFNYTTNRCRIKWQPGFGKEWVGIDSLADNKTTVNVWEVYP